MGKAEDDEIIRQAMGLLGSRKTEKKANTARENGRAGGRPRGGRPLAEIPCNCPTGPDGPDDAHRAICPRGRAYRRRQKATD